MVLVVLLGTGSASLVTILGLVVFSALACSVGAAGELVCSCVFVVIKLLVTFSDVALFNKSS